MTPLVDDPDFTLHVGDVRAVLSGLEAESVHCVVTSPPYWGLRDYGTGEWEGGDAECDHKTGKLGRNDNETLTAYPVARGAGGTLVPIGGNPTKGGELFYRDTCGKCGARRVDRQLGLEPTPEEYVSNMVEVFREVRRVLRVDGTCWLNLGDSYNTSASGVNGIESSTLGGTPNALNPSSTRRTKQLIGSLKPKDLVGIPWRVAFALQADGWWLRSDIIWSKPNPMPESVTDRPTKAHEYLFLLTKASRYFFDQEAVREAHNHDGRSVTAVLGGNGSIQHRDGERWPNAGRNIRSVWEIATEPYPEAHFATFPQALVEPCIKAGTSERGCCPECGAPWVREKEETPEYTAWKLQKREQSYYTLGTINGVPRSTKGTHGSNPSMYTTTGWHPGCACYDPANVHGETDPATALEAVGGIVPCIVLDPFLGSGTTALVARRLGRKCVGVELSPEYAALAARRLQQLSLLA